MCPSTSHEPAGRTGPVARVAIGLIRVYQLTLSAFIGRSCRYAPTCSEYTSDAIRQHGLWAGVWIGLARLQRCRPGGGSGFDPVPETCDHRAFRFRPWRFGRWRSDHIDPSTRLD
ncbi:membrane protein insertion efficiency factor YidD [Stappia sp. ES.058]|uniref:membrane protein insertion efficiency factor YidD n=1 Tax=Stappia sp. ES.058 TaxID=1881061 RepID=UPI000B862425|nr:membrane protein insertion efficiency factor YidD [Stappia sp. ES.058]